MGTSALELAARRARAALCWGGMLGFRVSDAAVDQALGARCALITAGTCCWLWVWSRKG